ncbi:hypothetical protein N6H18_03330 [Reichenbachiella agarivorans]|uniref:Uncharacterized protein n=1 Tax=Reichenbachiella agarivorans TaxID=2979464 RepID=A0ABY6CR60_9BACT|nr:hypothetical protein [Reichenbachiella agarivorans]UXP32987.1 hypothetical protein N6H18_03330 [Reichenbachiella agarivorans]
MTHLITVMGKSARNFFLDRAYLSDFISLMSTLTSGRVTMVSTRFRSDLFYSCQLSAQQSILKMWALYAKASLADLDRKDLIRIKGDRKALTRYFQSINLLSANWYQYGQYRKAFLHAYHSDQQNPIIKTIVACDQYLLKQRGIARTPLVNPIEKQSILQTKDTFAIAMYLLNNESHTN